MPSYAQYYQGLNNAQANGGFTGGYGQQRPGAAPPLGQLPPRQGAPDYTMGPNGIPQRVNSYMQDGYTMYPGGGGGGMYGQPQQTYGGSGQVGGGYGYNAMPPQQQQPNPGYWDMRRRRGGMNYRSLALRSQTAMDQQPMMPGMGMGGGAPQYNTFTGPRSTIYDPPPAYRPPMSAY